MIVSLSHQLKRSFSDMIAITAIHIYSTGHIFFLLALEDINMRIEKNTCIENFIIKFDFN